MVQRAVATCHKVNMGSGRKKIPQLLDCGSQVNCISQNYFKREILPHTIPGDGEKAMVHQLIWLTAANTGKLPMSTYVIRSRLFGDHGTKSQGSGHSVTH